MRTVALVLFGAVVVAASAGGRLAGAPVPKHLMKEPASDKSKLQGKWKVASMKMGGTDIMADAGLNFDMVIEFRGDTLIATADVGGTFQKTTATVKHDAGAGVKRFATTETRIVDKDGNPVSGADQKDESLAYALDGEKLVLVASGGNAKPPVDALKPGPADVVLVLVRAK